MARIPTAVKNIFFSRTENSVKARENLPSSGNAKRFFDARDRIERMFFTTRKEIVSDFWDSVRLLLIDEKHHER